MKAIIHKMCWPSKKEESATLIDTLRSLVQAIDRALNVDSNVTIRAMDSTTKEIKDAVDRQEQEARLWKQQHEWTKAEETRADILRWLSDPDPSENHNNAFEHRNSRAGTGRWFLEGPLFQQFKTMSGSMRWLHGDPGSGKSVPCSAVIEDLWMLQSATQTVNVAYWYFNNNDNRTTTFENHVRALLTQLISMPQIPLPLIDHWRSMRMRSTRLKISDLRRTLQRVLIDEGEMVCFIFLDALDESDEDDREKLFDLIQNISLLGGLDIHFFVTSRTNTTDAKKS